MSKYTNLAEFIVNHVGGKNNIKNLSHCMTRLRFVLKDEKRADTNLLKSKEGVLSVIQSGGEYQVVIGNTVPEVYDEVIEIIGLRKETNEEENEKQSFFNSFIDVISKIFNPILGLLCGTGIIKGMSVLLVGLKLITQDSGTFQILQIVGDSFLYFAPIYLGFTAAKKFKLNEFTGIAIGACLLHPTITKIIGQTPLYSMFEGTIISSPVHTTFLKIPVLLMDYAGSVVPIIFACYFAAKIEKVFKKVIPNVVKMFLVPALTLLIIVPITLIIIGPISILLSNIISTGLTSLYEIAPVISGTFIAGFWQILIVFGLHRAFTPITFSNLSLYGYDSVFAVRIVIAFAVLGVTLAIYLKSKNKKAKETALPAAISSFFGVTEPAIYGITIRNKRIFIITSIACAVGGGILSFFGSKVYSITGLGILGLPSYISPEGIGMDFWGTIIGVLASMVVGFVLTWTIGCKDENQTIDNEKGTDNIEEKDFDILEIETPISGEVIQLEDVKDPIFASGALGAGIAVEPSEGIVVSPVDGVVTSLFPTGHAIGITTKEGVEILIHIGMDTVKLNGRHFNARVNQGDNISKGQKLIEFDLSAIKSEGYAVTTPIVITNNKDFSDVVLEQIQKVGNGQKIITIIK